MKNIILWYFDDYLDVKRTGKRLIIMISLIILMYLLEDLIDLNFRAMPDLLGVRWIGK